MPLAKYSLSDYKNLAVKNEGEFILENIPKNTRIRVEGWKCDENHTFTSSFESVKNGIWCPVCKKTVVKIEIENYIKAAKEHGGEYILDYIPETIRKKAIDAWKCKRGHIFSGDYEYIKRRGYWCRECLKIENRENKKKCIYQFKTGKNKGNQCTREAVTEEGLCQTHLSYIKKQQEVKEEREKKKIQVEPNEETINTNVLELVLPYYDNQIRIFGTSHEPWFVGKDIAEILGYEKSRNAIERHVDEEDKTTMEKQSLLSICKNAQPNMVLISKRGVITLIQKSRHPLSNHLIDFFKTKFNIEIDVYKNCYKEQKIIPAIQECFKDMESFPHYRVEKYYIDLYFPKFNIAVECDENNHNNYNRQNEIEREEKIKQKLNCQFYRFNPDSPSFDIFKVIFDLRMLLK